MKKFILGLIFLVSLSQVFGQVIIVEERTRDTLVLTTKTIQPTPYQTVEIVRKPYKQPTTPPDPPPTSSAYQTLPVSNPINYRGRSNVVIENLRFTDVEGTAIILTDCSNVTIRNCFFNKATEEAISAERCTNVLAEKNLFNGVASGMYALGGSNIRVINNQNINSHVRTKGGRGNLAQFDGVTGGAVENNRSVGWPNENKFEDHVSLFKSTGVSVKNNILVGGGPSESGSGIMTGDFGGGNHVISDNILLSTGSVGIGIAGGSNITVTNNKIFGQQTDVSNNPLYVWAQRQAPCGNNTVKLNFVQWIGKDGKPNRGWNAGNCPGTVYDPNENKPLALSDLGLPSDWNQIINFIKPEDVAKIRGK